MEVTDRIMGKWSRQRKVRQQGQQAHRVPAEASRRAHPRAHHHKSRSRATRGRRWDRGRQAP
eukprot:986883-Heterocapsa_arctica.AAC.1